MTVNPDRLKRIMELGLTEYQGRAYLALLELGTATASQVPPVSRVPRTRVYATMNQLHEKGLVEILPETPLRYRPVPIQRFLEKQAGALREEAQQLEGQAEAYGREFGIRGELAVGERGRFEAIYGRRNARERLMKMYEGAREDIIGVGTIWSPTRIVKSAIYTLEEKTKQGVTARFAFPVTATNKEDVDRIAQFAKIRAITVHLPIYFYVFDDREILFNHPIPDDDDFHQGEDIAIWTDDRGIARAMGTIAEKIWTTGTEPGTLDVTEPVLEVTRKFVQLLGHLGQPAFAAMGREVGVALAASFEATDAKPLVDEMALFWRRNGLGRLAVTREAPLVLEVENFVDCGKMLTVGRTICGFVGEVVAAILEAKVGPVALVENECHGEGSRHCRIVFQMPS